MSKELIRALIVLLQHDKILTAIEILQDELTKVEPIKAKIGEGVSLTKNQRIANSMKTMTWKTIK